MTWLREDVAGLDLGDAFIAAARVKRGGGVKVTHGGVREYEGTAAEEAVAKAVRQLWSDLAMPTRTVCASLRSVSMVMRHFKWPIMSDMELSQALALQAEEALHMPRDEVEIDWHVNASQPSPAEGYVEGTLIAVPKRDIERQLAILRLAGLYPVAFDVGAMAAANWFLDRAPALQERTAVCLVCLSSFTADIAVLVGRDWIYPHTAFCRAAAWDMATEFLAEHILEITRYFEAKLRREPVSEVVLTGQVPAAEGFISTLSAKLRRPVRVWSPLQNVTSQASRVQRRIEAAPQSAALMTTALGLALRGNW